MHMGREREIETDEGMSTKNIVDDDDVIKEGDAVCFTASNGVQFVMTIHPDNFYRHGKKQIRIMDCVGHKYGTIFEARPYVDSEKEKKGEGLLEMGQVEGEIYRVKLKEKQTNSFFFSLCLSFTLPPPHSPRKNALYPTRS